jgi:hypothetical protein
MRKISLPPGFDSRTVQPVASRYTDCATPGPILLLLLLLLLLSFIRVFACNRNEYQEYFLGVKVAGTLGWQPYYLHVPIVLKSGSLNLLEPSGLVQACNGIALPLCNYIYNYIPEINHVLGCIMSQQFSSYSIWYI